MKDIFDIINPPPKPQVSIQELPQQIEKQPKEKKLGIVVGHIHQPFMKQLIDDGKQDLSSFVVAPKRSFMTSGKIKKEFIKQLKRIDVGGLTGFIECIKLAKHRKINLSKIAIEIRRNGEYYTLNPLEYLLFKFSYDPKYMAQAIQYLIANEPRLLTEKKIKDAIYVFMQLDEYKGRHNIMYCDKEFLTIYKILLDYGAKNPDISELLFEDEDCKTFVNENYDLIELMLYSNNADLNKNILNAFYTCEDPELFYPILERYGIKPDLNTAISKLRYENAQDVLKYLTDIGVFDKKDLTEQRIRDAIVEHQVCGIVTASRVILKAREIRDGTQEEIEAKQKQIEERELAIQQEKRTQMQKMQIQQVYENAVKNIELTQ